MRPSPNLQHLNILLRNIEGMAKMVSAPTWKAAGKAWIMRGSRSACLLPHMKVGRMDQSSMDADPCSSWHLGKKWAMPFLMNFCGITLRGFPGKLRHLNSCNRWQRNIAPATWMLYSRNGSIRDRMYHQRVEKELEARISECKERMKRAGLNNESG